MTSNSSEREPLLVPRPSDEGPDQKAVTHSDADLLGESFDNVPKNKRQLGLASAVFLIFNRVIGTGIFATPSVIMRSAGSVGLSLCMWLLGASVAASGMAVYVEFGTGLPRNGGEKNYLEYLYKNPRFFTTCVYTMFIFSSPVGSANCVVFGEYVVHALGLTPTLYNVRSTAVACMLFSVVMHSFFMKSGLRLQNILGFSKLFILLAIVLIGVFHLAGVPGFELQEGVEVPRNLEWDTFWEGSNTGTLGLVTGLYNVIWSFVGYNNANYALSEIRDPVRTIKRAAPLALGSVTVAYLLINIAYFAVVSKSDIQGGGRVVAALFFRNLFGASTERLISGVIAMSLLGNSLASFFVQGRVIQELGREGIPPFSRFFASNKPLNTPMAALFTQLVISSLYAIAPPPGDAYLLMLNLTAYPIAVINLCLSAGLLLLRSRKETSAWNPPFRAYHWAAWFFFLSNVLLVTLPLVPPADGYRVYERLPYFLHVLVVMIFGSLGVVYWYVWSIWIPRRRGYRLVRESVLHADGMSRTVFNKVPQ